MTVRKIDTAGDWLFGRGKADYADTEAEIEERIRTRLLSWRRDSFSDPEAGIDWHGRLDKGQEAALEEEIRSALLLTPGVVGVNSLTVTKKADRSVLIVPDVVTIYSPSFQRSIQLTVGG